MISSYFVVILINDAFGLLRERFAVRVFYITVDVHPRTFYKSIIEFSTEL